MPAVSRRLSSKPSVAKPHSSKPSASVGARLSLSELGSSARGDGLADFWQKLLLGFVGPTCDSFSLGGCQALELARLHVFNDWQPGLKDSTVVRFQWDVAASERTRDLRLRRFELESDVIDRLARLPFDASLASNEQCPVERLYFFWRQQLVLEAEPNERSLLFYELTPARCELLQGIEPRAVPALNNAGNWTATTLLSVDKLKRRA